MGKDRTKARVKDKTFRQTFVINFALASPARVRKRSKASFSNLALKE
jgi:hypothetical protein